MPRSAHGILRRSGDVRGADRGADRVDPAGTARGGRRAVRSAPRPLRAGGAARGRGGGRRPGGPGSADGVVGVAPVGDDAPDGVPQNPLAERGCEPAVGAPGGPAVLRRPPDHDTGHPGNPLCPGHERAGAGDDGDDPAGGRAHTAGSGRARVPPVPVQDRRGPVRGAAAAFRRSATGRRVAGRGHGRDPYPHRHGGDPSRGGAGVRGLAGARTAGSGGTAEWHLHGSGDVGPPPFWHRR